MLAKTILCRVALPLTGAAVVAATLAGSALADTAPPAPAASSAPRGLSAIQQVGRVAIELRLTDLNAALTLVNSAGVLTAGDKATLLTTLNGDVSGLTALGRKIAADTDVATARADYHQIFSGYRVFALALPQVHYARAIDTVTSQVVPKLTSVQATLTQLLTSTGKGNSTTQAAMADLNNQIGVIETATSGLSATVIAYTPADWNANHSLLSGPRQTMANVRADVAKARADVKTVVSVLK